MLRSRRAYFRRQSFSLYARYVHVVVVLLALFGVALIDRPALLAEPILHFWREPGSPGANAGWAGAWLALVATWTRIHRGFIGGGALAAFTRSLPQAVRAGPLVNAAMLCVGLQVFLLPAALAAWTVATGAGGAGQWFGLRAALLAAMTLGVAQWASSQVARITGAVLAVGFAALIGLGRYGAFEPAILALMTLLAAGAVLRDMLRPPPAADTGPALAVAGGPPLPGMLFLVALQARMLARAHLHAALPRIGLAIAVQVACLWMIFGVGKIGEAASFVKVCCWITVAILSGFHFLFWSARQPLQPYLASLPHGLLRMALSEQLLVLAATLTVFAGAYGACLLQPGQGAAVAALVLRHGAASLVALPLLGLPIIQRHQDGHLLKVAILVVTFLLL